MTHTPEFQEVLDGVIKQAQIVAENKECLVAHYIKNNPDAKIENIRFCQMQKYEGNNPHWVYWIEDTSKRLGKDWGRI